ncbi:hypothetical protein [Arthrobacter cryoconiti]|uniref:Uncharacterized protein n=1 Tax=Arthrobacter cryoconiti TaxID=748907 RepID=A0ABV8R3N0_9MICC|nr:hypothetical protein [Arthrobacter cryoconiti]MCC9066853.1 hypothetical protein [Arthrobacter cryoconiti]
MNTNTRDNGTRFVWMGFAAGLACMLALFIYGLVRGSAPMLVMASSVGVVLGSTWTATSVALKKRAREAAAAA